MLSSLSNGQSEASIIVGTLSALAIIIAAFIARSAKKSSDDAANSANEAVLTARDMLKSLNSISDAYDEVKTENAAIKATSQNCQAQLAAVKVHVENQDSLILSLKQLIDQLLGLAQKGDTIALAEVANGHTSIGTK